MNTASVTNGVTALLDSKGWAAPWNWKNVANFRVDKYGNRVSIHETVDTVRIEFEHASAPHVVETLDLDPTHGAERVVTVIEALTVSNRHASSS